MFNISRAPQAVSVPQPIFPDSLVGYCAADVTKNNNTTLADICSVQLPKSGIYSIYGFVTVSVANATPLIKIGLTGTTLTKTNLNTIVRFTDPTNSLLFAQLTTLTTTNSTTSGIGINIVEFMGSIEVLVGGKLAIQAAQATANASNTVFQRGSILICQKVNS